MQQNHRGIQAKESLLSEYTININYICAQILKQNVFMLFYSLFCFSVLVSLGRCAEAALLTPWAEWTGGLCSSFSSSLLSSSESLLSSALTQVPLEETCQENHFGQLTLHGCKVQSYKFPVIKYYDGLVATHDQLCSIRMNLIGSLIIFYSLIDNNCTVLLLKVKIIDFVFYSFGVSTKTK